jgi:hypothetical protein
MDTAILVEELDRSAFKLVNALNNQGFAFTAAALMKNQDAEDWYVVLGIPELHTKGSRDSFAVIYNTIKENNLGLSLNDIKLLDDRDITLLLLKRRFNSSQEISRTFFTGNYIDGTRFPDSIIYMVK